MRTESRMRRHSLSLATAYTFQTFLSGNGPRLVGVTLAIVSLEGFLLTSLSATYIIYHLDCSASGNIGIVL